MDWLKARLCSKLVVLDREESSIQTTFVLTCTYQNDNIPIPVVITWVTRLFHYVSPRFRLVSGRYLPNSRETLRLMRSFIMDFPMLVLSPSWGATFLQFDFCHILGCNHDLFNTQETHFLTCTYLKEGAPFTLPTTSGEVHSQPVTLDFWFKQVKDASNFIQALRAASYPLTCLQTCASRCGTSGKFMHDKTLLPWTAVTWVDAITYNGPLSSDTFWAAIKQYVAEHKQEILNESGDPTTTVPNRPARIPQNCELIAASKLIDSPILFLHDDRAFRYVPVGKSNEEDLTFQIHRGQLFVPKPKTLQPARRKIVGETKPVCMAAPEKTKCKRKRNRKQTYEIKLTTINIGSLSKHFHQVVGLDSNIIALQETALTQKDVLEMEMRAKQHGVKIIWGGVRTSHYSYLHKSVHA